MPGHPAKHLAVLNQVGNATVNGTVTFFAVAIAIGLAGCADVTPGFAPASASASGGSYAFPSVTNGSLLKSGNHLGPYDNTGNTPGWTGLEGGGG